ncbi:MAG: aminomethyl-transferring glycine dehydrogenase [Bacteroidota bacterium]
MGYTKHPDTFARRHIGPTEEELAAMLAQIGVETLEELIEQTLPDPIRLKEPLPERGGIGEYAFLNDLKRLAGKNKVFKSYIGLGYYNCITPSVILRNIFENPGWYTQYTPYQAEIAQGRLEALLNFQTLVSDLTQLPIANASLLDESTAAAEGMTLAYNYTHKKNRKSVADTIWVSDKCFPQTLEVVQTRASGLGIHVKVFEDWEALELDEKVFAVLVQYPDVEGRVYSMEQLSEKVHANGSYLMVAADLLSLTLLKAPGEMGADIVLGSAQRMGVPLGFGGPHAAYFATREEFLRLIPGRIIGVSIDALNQPALRMALQTREQHIRRDKATSNICTAQALLAIMAGMYAVYHGPDGLRKIGEHIHNMTRILYEGLSTLGFTPVHSAFFDTLTVQLESEEAQIRLEKLALSREINLLYSEEGKVGISLDESIEEADIRTLLEIFAMLKGGILNGWYPKEAQSSAAIPKSIQRGTPYLTHPVFNQYHSETGMMRYIKQLEDKDLSLNTAMIPLGSCTMKLNAATELIPVSWPAFSQIHPFVPQEQRLGYTEMMQELGDILCEVTGFDGISFQPNSGAQGEYAGLMVIRAWHLHQGNTDRNIALIPSSAHGTNPASAVMAGMKVVVVACDEMGNIDVEDLRQKAEKYSSTLSCLMVTYPSTHGVFETRIQEICQLIHEHGGQVYMDGANMNAQVGLTSPGMIGADVCHLNLHKTFSIPHGGGGPGMGPICVAEHLTPFLPGHNLVKTGGENAISAVSATPFGSASILLISYAYAKLLGTGGMTEATKMAILNANYMKERLKDAYPVLFEGNNGRVAHEFILDLRSFKHEFGLEVDDITKRLIDYGFHAPTVSWPVPGTIMIEPTESEPLLELDRFCDAMLKIREEIEEIRQGIADKEDNVLKHAPHTLLTITSDDWQHAYSREKAAFPVAGLKKQKFWPSVARVNNTYGDRNVVCTCPPMEAYEEV